MRRRVHSLAPLGSARAADCPPVARAGLVPDPEMDIRWPPPGHPERPSALYSGAMSEPASRSIEDIPRIAAAGPLTHTLMLRKDPLGFLRELSRGGDIFRMRLLDKVVVVLTGPAALQQGLVEGAAALEKSSLTRYLLYPLAGEGLFTSRGKLWRRQRRLMAPIFPPAQIACFADCMVVSAQRGADTWTDGATVDLWRETTRITMAIAGMTLFGAETFSDADELGAALTESLRWIDDQKTTLLPLAQIALRDSLERFAERMPGRLGALSASLAGRLHGPVLLWGAADRRMKEAVALLDRRVHRMIDERRTEGQPSRDLLGRLLAARDEDDGAAMSDKQVRDEVITLFLEAHETTASAMAWAIYLLVRAPEVYRAARAEADALGRPPRHEDLPRLKLALRVFKESLRLYPPLPTFTRDARAELTVGGYRLPAGTVLIISPYATHHRADLWPDPERFDPDRFTPEAEAARPRYAYVPFSGGPRVCIGNHFALMEGALVLATLLQRVDFELSGSAEAKPEVGVTLRPSGMSVRIRRRPDLGGC
jgi:cytochrome P450